MSGQETRNKLTDYWKDHDIKEGQEYATLTNIIHQECFGSSINKHQKLKGLEKKHNLRDHMTEAELLFTALAELSESYAPVFTAKIEIDRVTEEYLFTQQEVSLAIYRVVEQGIQNATIHGKATQAEIRISRIGDELVLLLRNNGAPFDPNLEQVGTGLSIIRAWVEAVNGAFSLKNLPEGGVLLEARFGLTDSVSTGVIP
jgi:signal transduction histidine kinase